MTNGTARFRRLRVALAAPPRGRRGGPDGSREALRRARRGQRPDGSRPDHRSRRPRPRTPAGTGGPRGRRGRCRDESPRVSIPRVLSPLRLRRLPTAPGTAPRERAPDVSTTPPSSGIPQHLYVETTLLEPSSVTRLAANFEKNLDAVLANGSLEIVVADPQPRQFLEATRDPQAVRRALAALSASVSGKQSPEPREATGDRRDAQQPVSEPRDDGASRGGAGASDHPGRPQPAGAVGRLARRPAARCRLLRIGRIRLRRHPDLHSGDPGNRDLSAERALRAHRWRRANAAPERIRRQGRRDGRPGGPFARSAQRRGRSRRARRQPQGLRQRRFRAGERRLPSDLRFDPPLRGSRRIAPHAGRAHRRRGRDVAGKSPRRPRRLRQLLRRLFPVRAFGRRKDPRPAHHEQARGSDDPQPTVHDRRHTRLRRERPRRAGPPRAARGVRHFSPPGHRRRREDRQGILRGCCTWTRTSHPSSRRSFTWMAGGSGSPSPSRFRTPASPSRPPRSSTSRRISRPSVRTFPSGGRQKAGRSP